jgi:hypothetical protein
MHISRPLAQAISICLFSAAIESAAAGELWSDSSTSVGTLTARRANDLPSRFRSVGLDRSALDTHMRTSRAASARSIELPLPDGGSTRFELDDATVLPPGLAARYPNLTSLKGRDSAGRRVRLDVGPDGLHAAVRDPAGDWLVRPESTEAATRRGTQTTHIVFRRADASTAERTEGEEMIDATRALAADPSARGAGPGVIRSFRIAMAATSAYTRHMGGTVEDGLAGVVRTVNRVNEIFENDLGVHLTLAENNDRLIFTREADDPYASLTRDMAIALLNVEITEKILGNGAFDVGHVLDGRRGSGVAGAIGNTCQPWSGETAERGTAKAAGMTGSLQPFGDAFHVDYVAHELGHQFGARHTFNGCREAQRDDRGAFAPGSGSTIMGYAGICEAAHGLQAQSDAYFHAASIEQIQAWLASVGGACATARVNTSPAPWLDTDGWQRPLVVPARTPFRLSGKATFADPAASMTYTFEQLDLGDMQERGAGVADTGNGPLFRSRPPHTEGEQTFPAMSVLLGDELPGLGDAVPTTSRHLRFRMTARDNRDQRSHVVSADRSVQVVDTRAAFQVTAPKANAVVRRGKPRQVTWNVAGTVQAPIACARVRIDLSLDGGRSFLDIPIAPSAPNKGRASITVPDNIPASRHARLRVACADGRFFALSPGEIDLR